MLLLISDLHLSPERPEITQAFYRFLQKNLSSPHIEALYILGDLFDVWIGDDENHPVYLEILNHLKQWSDQKPLLVMHGNRDFFMGRGFERQTGATLLNDPSMIQYKSNHYLLMHGDSLCTKDEEFMAFRQQTRSPEWQSQILSLPLDERRNLAKEYRQASKTMNSLKAADIIDVTPEEVDKIMAEYRINTLIHGHTHRPDIHEVKQGQRIVLGDWNDKGWYVLIEERAELIQFDLSDIVPAIS